MPDLLELAKANAATVTRVALSASLLPKTAKDALMTQAQLITRLATELDRLRRIVERGE